MKVIVAGIILTVLGVASAQAQSRPENCSIWNGTYRTWQIFPSVSPATAIDNLARAGQASGFWSSVQVDERAGFIRAENDGAGNGRTQEVTISVRRQSKGTRVDYAIALQPGQTPREDFLVGLCRFLSNSAGG
jgi:hypothetical protein